MTRAAASQALARLAAHPEARRWADACRFTPSTEVSCAVSGGPDSTALLLLARLSGRKATAIHVDHGIRPGSDRDIEAVQAIAAAVGADFESHRVVIDAGGDLEARARWARRAVLPPDVLYGHTLDDQAETVVLAMLRGAGLDGLAGMRTEQHPLLLLRRVDTEAVVAASGLDPVRDPTNDDPRFRRNRVRAELMPLLDDIAARDVAAVIARQTGLLRDEADLLDQLASAIDPTDVAALRAAPLALARRALRQWLRSDAGAHPPDAAAVERVLEVAAGTRLATEIAGGRRVSRSRGRLLLTACATFANRGGAGQ